MYTKKTVRSGSIVFFIGEYNMLTCDYIAEMTDGDYAHPPMMVSGYKVQLPDKSVLQKNYRN